MGERRSSSNTINDLLDNKEDSSKEDGKEEENKEEVIEILANAMRVNEISIPGYSVFDVQREEDDEEEKVKNKEDHDHKIEEDNERDEEEELKKELEVEEELKKEKSVEDQVVGQVLSSPPSTISKDDQMDLDHNNHYMTDHHHTNSSFKDEGTKVMHAKGAANFMSARIEDEQERKKEEELRSQVPFEEEEEVKEIKSKQKFENLPPQAAIKSTAEQQKKRNESFIDDENEDGDSIKDFLIQELRDKKMEIGKLNKQLEVF